MLSRFFLCSEPSSVPFALCPGQALVPFSPHEFSLYSFLLLLAPHFLSIILFAKLPTAEILVTSYHEK